MKSVSIQGKPYVMVNERIKEFRENEKYKGWSLESEIIRLDENSCVIKAIIKDLTGTIRATGLAQEDKGSSFINKTSFVENCETSAWGRALGCLGIGIDDAIASAEEVTMAIVKQINEPKSVEITKENAVISGNEIHCVDCDESVSKKVAEYSVSKYGKVLCFDCQKHQKPEEVEV